MVKISNNEAVNHALTVELPNLRDEKKMLLKRIADLENENVILRKQLLVFVEGVKKNKPTYTDPYLKAQGVEIIGRK